MATFGTAINCIDGRVQVPVIEYLKGEFELDYVDSVTEPGPITLFADSENEAIPRILQKVAISAEKHGSKNLAIVGHFDCAANPVDEEKQKRQIRHAIRALNKLLGDRMQVLGLWVDDQWTVHRVTE